MTSDVVLSAYTDLGLDPPHEPNRCHAFTDPKGSGGGMRCKNTRLSSISWTCHTHLGSPPEWVGLFRADNDMMVERDGEWFTLAAVQDRLAAREADALEKTLLDLRRKLRERPVTEDQTHVCEVCGAYNPPGGVRQPSDDDEVRNLRDFLGGQWICVDEEGCIERSGLIADHQTDDDAENLYDEWEAQGFSS